MKTIEVLALKKLLKPYADHIFIADWTYITPSRNKVWSMVKDNYIDEYKYISSVFDCDDFALVLHAWMRQEQYRRKWKYPWAFGEAWTKKHALNITLTDEGLMLIEPQNDEMRKINEKDHYTFIRM